MTSKRFFLVMVGIAILLLLGFGAGVYKVNSMFNKESDKLAELKLSAYVLKEQQSVLRQAKRDITEFSGLEEITRSIIPEDKNQANTIGEIASHAKKAGISLGAIEFPQSELGRVAKGKAKTKSTTDSSTTQLVEVDDLKGVYVMSISIRNHSEKPIAYDQILDFLKRLESNRRTAQVVEIGIQPDQKTPNLFHFTIKLNTYIRPD